MRLRYASGPSKPCTVAAAQHAAGAGGSGSGGASGSGGGGAGASGAGAGAGGGGRYSKPKVEDTTPLWVNKYKPCQPAQLIGGAVQVESS
jgi:hypothetical protein